MRAPTLAEHARFLAVYSDRIVDAVHSGNATEIELVRDQVAAHRPPHGFSAADALMVVLAAQIDRSVPVAQRLEWVYAMDPMNTEAAA